MFPTNTQDYYDFLLLQPREELEELLQAGDVDQDGLLNISEFGFQRHTPRFIHRIHKHK